MKKFILPEVEIRDLSPVQTIMDDITVSSETGFGGREQVVNDPATGSDEAVW